MSGLEILIDRKGPLVRAATVRDGRLEGLQLDHDERPSRLGSVVLGRVDRIVPSMNAAFVALGEGATGFLNASDIRMPGATSRKAARAPDRPIGQLLRAGQPVLAQVKAEPGGTKAPVLTMDVVLPGRFVVMTPLTPGITLSKRLGKGEVRSRLMRVVEAASAGGGWIIRSSAAPAHAEALVAEIEALSAAWRGIEAQGLSGAAPAGLLPPPDAPRRAVLELGGLDVSAITVADGAIHAGLSAWLSSMAPDLAPRLALHRGAEALFDRYDLNGAIAGLAGRRVDLPGGGWLAVERTEALTVVDVNGGERGAPLATNLEAAAELARQLRLRNLGGIVVVDFIDMRAPADRERLIQALSAAVAEDPAGTHVYGMTRLGLVEMTRARRGPSVDELLLATVSSDAN